MTEMTLLKMALADICWERSKSKVRFNNNPKNAYLKGYYYGLDKASNILWERERQEYSMDICIVPTILTREQADEIISNQTF